MALIKCRECGKEYSSLAKACPNYECPTKYSINQNYEPIKYSLLGFERKLDDVLFLNAVITPDSYQQKVFLKFDIGGHNIIDYASDLLSFVFSDLDALKTMLINGDERMTITKDSLILKQNNITIKQIKQLNDDDYWPGFVIKMKCISVGMKRKIHIIRLLFLYTMTSCVWGFL